MLVGVAVNGRSQAISWPFGVKVTEFVDKYAWVSHGTRVALSNIVGKPGPLSDFNDRGV